MNHREICNDVKWNELTYDL